LHRALLGQIAKRLATLDERQLLVARFSGDVFSVLVEGARAVHDIDQVAQDILQTFCRAILPGWWRVLPVGKRGLRHPPAE